MQKEQLKAIQILKNALLKNKKIKNPNDFAMKIEKSIHKYVYNYASDNYKPLDWNSHIFLDLYTSTLQKIEQHINPASDINKKFGNYTINAIISGELNIDKIAEYKSEQLNPKAQQKERTEYDISSNQKIHWKTTKLVTCDKCGKNKCSYYSVQTRSADEPETVFYKCWICGNEWSINN